LETEKLIYARPGFNKPVNSPAAISPHGDGINAVKKALNPGLQYVNFPSQPVGWKVRIEID